MTRNYDLINKPICCERGVFPTLEQNDGSHNIWLTLFTLVVARASHEYTQLKRFWENFQNLQKKLYIWPPFAICQCSGNFDIYQVGLW